MRAAKATAKPIDLPWIDSQIIEDYRLAYRSRQASLIGRREVLSGKAKFGIFGDGKELANIAIGHVFRKGDWRSGYYRDQTWMDMLGVMSLQQMFAQLYAHADLEAEPNTGGRGMNAHFAIPLRPCRRLLDRSNRLLQHRCRRLADRNPDAARRWARVCFGGLSAAEGAARPSGSSPTTAMR